MNLLTEVKAVMLVGNPIANSRTRVAADCFTSMLEELGATVTTIDLALMSVEGLAHGQPDDEARAAVDLVLGCDLLVVVTPIYKATYTGILKLLFDALRPEALTGKVAIPVILGAGPGHVLVIEHALKPLFAELGAVSPARGLFVIDKLIDKESRAVDDSVKDGFLRVVHEATHLIRRRN